MTTKAKKQSRTSPRKKKLNQTKKETYENKI